MELINKKALLSRANKPEFSSKFGLTKLVDIRVIRAAPTVDAVPVVRGKWLDPNGGVKCSVCTMVSHMKYNYCPNCGAKMED